MKGADYKYPKSIITFQDQQVENLDTFKFLGSLVNYMEVGTGDVELNNRIEGANKKFGEYLKVLKNYKLNISTRMKYFNCFVRSRMVYSCQNWSLTKRQYDKIDIAHRKLLRRMLKGGNARKSRKDNNFAYKITNSKLYKICNSSELSEFIKDQQKKFAAHIIRQPNSSKVKQLTFNCDKYRKTGKPIPTLAE